MFFSVQYYTVQVVKLIQCYNHALHTDDVQKLYVVKYGFGISLAPIVLKTKALLWLIKHQDYRHLLMHKLMNTNKNSEIWLSLRMYL